MIVMEEHQGQRQEAGYPKVVVIGAGSLFFGRQSIWQMVNSPHLNQGVLALVDTDESRLERMVTLGRMVAAASGVPLRIEGSTDRRDVLPGADYVVLSFAKDTVKYRDLDCRISEKYGIRMCSGDTIGPGGIFRAMRELPEIMACAQDIRSLCPDAWVINYINPSAVNGIALSRYAPDLKSFALCDGLHMPRVKREHAVRAGIVPNIEAYSDETDAEFDFRIAGVNHFTWLLKAEYEGRDVMPAIAASIRREADQLTVGGDTGAKMLHNAEVGYALYDAFGYVPVCVGHTKEYMRFWQGLGKLPSAIPPLEIWSAEERYKRHDAMWRDVDDFVSGRRPIEQYMTAYGPDHATDIIENMVAGLGKPFYINTRNNGAVTNLADDAFLELLCSITKDGIERHPVGDMPRGLRGLQEQVLDTHELTVEAIIEQHYGKLRRAMLTDPLVSSIEDADRILKELLELERDALPDYWYA